MSPATLAEPPPRARRDAPPAARADDVPRPSHLRPRTAADLPALLERLGGIPPDRVRLDPPPGTARWEDVDRVRRETGRLCELIDRTLVEKAVSERTSWLAGYLITLLNNHVVPRRLGMTLTTDGFFHFGDDLRAPDVSFTPRERRTGDAGEPLARGYSDVPPSLVVEVISPGNTRREMELKRGVYFANRVERVWEVEHRSIRVWSDPETPVTLNVGDTLTGEPVLPGFTLKLEDLFINPFAAELPADEPGAA